jgi:hypothetical protein
MVIPNSFHSNRERGALMTELLVAIAILAIAVLPIGYSIAKERLLARGYYQRAIAMEIVDGEMEVLMAGGWRAFPQGGHEYSVHANALENLPPGKFLLTVQANKVRLEWQPDEKHQGGPVVREAVVK